MWMLLLGLVACTEPQSGNYAFTEVSETSDCPDSYSAGNGPTGDQTITVEADAVILEGDEPETCKRDGMAFSCSFSSVDETLDYNDQGLDAVYTIDASMEGLFTSAITLEGTFSLLTTCEGGDCAAVAAAGAPACEIVWEFEGALIE